ncbi:MAG: hypothetical protein HEP71_22780 [Roseivirga sp.]|nr:hypothetical protein [Roseivirga sp.]
MRDFTLSKYKELLLTLKNQSYTFLPYREFILNQASPCIVLRHDVDLRPQNSLQFARIQHENSIRGTYYFRAVPQSWDEDIILEIASLGHEIGYHYECLTTTNGNPKAAIVDFERNLEKLRKLAPVDTICMHGSPMSKYDSKDLWNFNDYRDFDIIGEPYFDVDFDRVFYITDTGRRWDGDKVSVRDKVMTSIDLSFKRTQEIIEAAESGSLPDQIMFTFHPQRWDDQLPVWVKELVFQKIKNIIKKTIFVKKA